MYTHTYYICIYILYIYIHTICIYILYIYILYVYTYHMYIHTIYILYVYMYAIYVCYLCHVSRCLGCFAPCLSRSEGNGTSPWRLSGAERRPLAEARKPRESKASRRGTWQFASAAFSCHSSRRNGKLTKADRRKGDL